VGVLEMLLDSSGLLVSGSSGGRLAGRRAGGQIDQGFAGRSLGGFGRAEV
jgi:hypothetical protein